MHCRLTWIRLGLVFTILTIAFSSASAQSQRGGTARSKAVSKPVGRDRVAKNPLSDQDCRAFAQAIGSALSAGDQAALNALIDWDALFDTALAGMSLPDTQRQNLIKELKSTIGLELGLTGQLAKSAKAGAKFAFLRTRQNPAGQAVQFRMTQPEKTGGVNYFEYILKRSPDGKVRAADIYVYLTAEFLSATFRRALLPVVASLSRTFLDKLMTNEQDVVQDLPKLQELISMVDQGKNQEAIAKFKALRPETQKEKWVLMLRLRATQHSDEKEYTAVLEDFRRLYPKDPCLDMVLVDYYTLKKDYPKVVDSIDRLDKAVGGDPYLNLMRASLSEARGDLSGAAKLAKLAIDREPTILQAYFYLIAITMRQEKYDETLAALKKQDQAFKMVYKDLKTVPAYAGFVKSPQYKEWLQYQAKRASKQKTDPGQTPADTKEPRINGKKAGSVT
jgi:hypothetical protein